MDNEQEIKSITLPKGIGSFHERVIVDQEISVIKRDNAGHYLKGNPPGPGRPLGPVPEEKKLARKASKEIIRQYIENLTAALPDIEEVLILKAKLGDSFAIKEIHDRAMGKPIQRSELTGAEGGPIEISDSKRKLVNEALTKYLETKS